MASTRHVKNADARLRSVADNLIIAIVKMKAKSWMLKAFILYANNF